LNAIAQAYSRSGGKPSAERASIRENVVFLLSFLLLVRQRASGEFKYMADILAEFLICLVSSSGLQFFSRAQMYDYDILREFFW
jgi:hypothetical protein